MFLETYDIGESFAKRVTIIREVNLVKPNTSCSKLSLGKTVNLHTEISMQYKKLTIMDSLSFKLVFCCMNDASFFTSSELLKILKKKNNLTARAVSVNLSCQANHTLKIKIMTQYLQF